MYFYYIFLFFLDLDYSCIEFHVHKNESMFGKMDKKW